MSPTPHYLTLFGALKVRDAAGRSVVFRGTKSGTLLAYLALYPDQIHSREIVAERLWPDGDPAANRNRLRQKLLVLRREIQEAGLLEEALLNVSRDTLHLRTENISTDLTLYRRALAEAKRASSPDAKEKYLSEAAVLYAGPLLQEYDEFWILTEREYLENRHVEILRELAALRQARGDLNGAEECLRALLALDPMREEAHTDLMRLYAAKGLPSQVRKQYQELERVLREEFDDAPSEATRQLAEELRKQAAVAIKSGGENGETVVSPLPVEEGGKQESGDEGEGRAQDNGHSPIPIISPVVSNITRPETMSRSARRVPSKAVVALLALLVMAAGGFWWNRLHTPRAFRPVWVAEYHAREGEIESSEARAVATDAEGNVYVCGFTQTYKEDVDILVLKYGPDGQPAWEYFPRYSSPGHDCDRAFAMIVDQSGVYVAGETYVPDNALPGKKGGWRLVILKYDRNTGAELWTDTFYDLLTENKDHKILLARDGLGGVYLGGTALKADGTAAILLLRYNSKGERLWHHVVERPSEARLRHLVARDNSVIACGTTRQPGSAPENHDGLVVRIDGGGREQWQLPITIANHNPGNDTAEKVTTDSEGNIYVSGIGDTLPPAQGTMQQALWLAKLTPNGSVAWQRGYITSEPRVDVYALEVGKHNDVYLCARSYMHDGVGEAVALCYASTGKRLWAAHFGKQGKRSAVPVVLFFPNEGPAVIAGNTFIPIAGGKSMEKEDYFLRAFSSDGATRWNVAYDTGADVNDTLRAAILFREKASSEEYIYAVGQSWSDRGGHLQLVKFAP